MLNTFEIVLDLLFQGSQLNTEVSMESSKAERMQHMLLKKKECEKIAMEVVLRLIEPNVDKDFLIQRVTY